jgi:tetratricopeptide (TPR) repeat protein
MKKVLFIAILFFLFVPVLVGQDTGRTALPTWQVQKYDIDVTIPSESSRVITSRATIAIKNISGRPATTLTLRIAPSAEVAAIKINDAAAEFSKSEEKINAASSLQRIVTRIASVPADGVLSAVVDYKLTLKDNTALGSISPNGSQLLPLSYWYPTPNSWFFTRGADAAPFRIKVNGQPAISAGVETAGVFDQKLNGQPFFAAGNWDVVNQSGVAVYAPKGISAEGQKRVAELAALLADARTFVSGILGKAPDVPLRIVSVRRGAGFSSGGTVLVDEALFRRPKIDSLTAMNIAEAAAKLWLGNAVVVNGEGYGIISEGLSRYLATEFLESKYGKDVADIERLRQRNAYAAVSKRDAPMTIVSPIDDFFYPVIANKGAITWRLLAKKLGSSEFWGAIKSRSEDGNLNIGELRTAFSSQKQMIDPLFDQVTDTNLIIGLPRVENGETKVALRNTGQNEVTVSLAATTASGQKLMSSAVIKPSDYGEGVFKTAEKVVRVEIDPEKLYPQIDYSDDVKPQETTDSDPLLAVKRAFDRQSATEFANAETLAKTLIRDLPRFDDLRILLARSQLALNKNADAEREFKAVLDEKLPTARSIAWAYVGLAEIAAKANQNDAAIKWAESAIASDAEYGASFAARNLRSRLGSTAASDPSIRTFFADFDKAAAANRKADVEALAMPGEVTRFIGGLIGSTEQWQTQIRQIDRIDANTVLVETNMSIKLLNKEIETGVAVYRLTKAGTGWKLSSVDMFEVR